MNRPVAHAAVGLPWAVVIALVRWVAVRKGWPRLTFAAARPVARHSGGRVLRGRLDGAWFITPEGEAYAVDPARIACLGAPPAGGVTVELVGGMETTLEGRFRPIVAAQPPLGPLGGRLLIGRVV